MGKYSKKSGTQHKGRRIVAAVFALLLIVLVIFAIAKWIGPNTAEEDQIKELVIQGVSEQGDAILVETTYGNVKYPFAFSEIMGVEAETHKDHSVLTFHAMIDGMIVKLYTLHFNDTEGMPVGTLVVADKTYVVTSQFYEANNLSEDSMTTFFAVQETINDVLISLSENEGFTAAD